MFEIDETTLDIQEPKGKYPVSDIRHETAKRGRYRAQSQHPLFSLKTLRTDRDSIDVVLTWLRQNPGRRNVM